MTKVTKAKSAIPSGHHTITPVLVLDNAAQAIAWYEKAFGASEIGRSTAPDGKLLHAEIQIGNSRVMLNDEMMNAKSPKTLGGSPASLWIYVEDCDALFKRALAAGAHVYGGTVGKMTDQFWGDRAGTVVDPYGFSWTIASRTEDLSPHELEQRQAQWLRDFEPQAMLS